MHRLAAVFLAGFACGMLFLALLLFWRPPRPIVIEAAQRPAVAPTARARLPVAAPEPPSKLVIPVKGVTARELVDSFDEMRGGHRHEAIDILAPRGTPVLAVAKGPLAKLFDSKAGGLTVYQFDESETWCFYYAHLDHYADGLIQGAVLHGGQVIGYVGTTGDAPPDTPHLHFAVFKLGPEKHWWQGTAIDPYPLLMNR